jgi:putative SOS response-associated peptidase YedK
VCGRYAAARPAEDIAASFGIRAEDVERRLDADWNVAPTKDVPVVVERDGRRVLTAARWGLVPVWADDPGIGARLVNARAETVAEKPAFRAALAARRCLLPADGWYEWTAGPDGSRLPWFLSSPGGEPLGFAGLWEVWYDAEGRPLVTCTIVTAAAPGDLAHLHDRAPVVVPPDAWADWLDPAAAAADVARLLRPVPSGRVVARRVAASVSNVRENGPQLLDPPEEPDQQTLF